jgi:hypothetical protein
MISKSFMKETQVFAGQTLGCLKGEMILFTMKDDNTSVGCYALCLHLDTHGVHG